jgi:ArsR family transcriptional regulator
MGRVLPILEAAETCAPLTGGAMNAQEAANLAAALKVIANPARLLAVKPDPRPAEPRSLRLHLVTPLGLSQSTVSHHLKVLLGAGLLEREQRGNLGASTGPSLTG